LDCRPQVAGARGRPLKLHKTRTQLAQEKAHEEMKKGNKSSHHHECSSSSQSVPPQPEEGGGGKLCCVKPTVRGGLTMASCPDFHSPPPHSSYSAAAPSPRTSSLNSSQHSYYHAPDESELIIISPLVPTLQLPELFLYRQSAQYVCNHFPRLKAEGKVHHPRVAIIL